MLYYGNAGNRMPSQLPGKPVFLPGFHFSVPGRGLFLFLFKQPGKIKGIVISHRPGYITDRQIGFLQKRTGPPDPVIQQIFLRRAAGDILKEAVQVGPLNIQVIRNYLDINRVGIIVFNIAQRFLYVADFLFLRRNIGSGKFAGQKIQIFIQNTVHHKVAVFRQVICLEHFFVTEPYPVVLPIMKIRSFQKRSPFQVLLYFYALKSDPGVSPGVIFIRFVIDQRVWTDQKGVSF